VKLGLCANVSTYGFNNKLWNTGWILICSGRANLQFVGEAHRTLNGPYRRGANFALGWVVCKLVASRSTKSSFWNVCDAFGVPLFLISRAAICNAAVTSLRICSKYWTCSSTLCSLVCNCRGGLNVG